MASTATISHLPKKRRYIPAVIESTTYDEDQQSSSNSPKFENHMSYASYYSQDYRSSSISPNSVSQDCYEPNWKRFKPNFENTKDILPNFRNQFEQNFTNNNLTHQNILTLNEQNEKSRNHYNNTLELDLRINNKDLTKSISDVTPISNSVERLRTSEGFQNGRIDRPAMEFTETKIKSEPLDLTVTSSSDRDCSSTMSSNASIGDYSSHMETVNSTSNENHNSTNVENQSNNYSKRESKELKIMKKNIDNYIEKDIEFQNFRNKVLGHSPIYSNSNMKRYKNNPYEVVDEDYLKKREKNNLSAQKCREKRNLHEKTNICLSHYLIMNNDRVIKDNQYLIEENKQLKLQLDIINNFIKFGNNNNNVNIEKCIP